VILLFDQIYLVFHMLMRFIVRVLNNLNLTLNLLLLFVVNVLFLLKSFLSFFSFCIVLLQKLTKINQMYLNL